MVKRTDGGTTRSWCWMLLAASCAAAWGVPPTTVRADSQPSWHQVRAEDGIVSWRRERPGRQLSALRAQAMLPGSVWDTLAVLDDIEQSCKWKSNCAEMKRIQSVSARETLVYARMDAPWPVRDRDVVVRVLVEYGAPGELFLRIGATRCAAMPPVNGVVRMPSFVAHYHLREVSAHQARVDYQLEFDPGGMLPDWLKARLARELAHDTLKELRARVSTSKQRGVYRARATALRLSARKHGYVDAQPAAAARVSR